MLDKHLPEDETDGLAFKASDGIVQFSEGMRRAYAKCVGRIIAVPVDTGEVNAYNNNTVKFES